MATATKPARPVADLSDVRLYDLGNARDVIDEWLAEQGGEWTPEIEQLLADLDLQFPVKVENVALYVRELLARAKAVETERLRLHAMEKALDNAAAGLKAYLQREMLRYGKTKVEGKLCTVALQDNSAAKLITPEYTTEQMRTFHEAGERWVRAHVVYAIDRGVLETIKADELPDGVRFEKGQHVRIR
jgi:phage gp36-like protein